MINLPKMDDTTTYLVFSVIALAVFVGQILFMRRIPLKGNPMALVCGMFWKAAILAIVLELGNIEFTEIVAVGLIVVPAGLTYFVTNAIYARLFYPSAAAQIQMKAKLERQHIFDYRVLFGRKVKDGAYFYIVVGKDNKPTEFFVDIS